MHRGEGFSCSRPDAYEEKEILFFLWITKEGGRRNALFCGILVSSKVRAFFLGMFRRHWEEYIVFDVLVGFTSPTVPTASLN